MTLLDELAGNPRPASRIAFLSDIDTETAAFTYDGTGPLLGGSVTFDRTQHLHRTGTVSVSNKDGAFTPGDNNLVAPLRLVRLERGAFVGISPEFVPLMTGLVVEPQDAEATLEVSFAVWSRLHLADQQFEAPVSFAAGARVRDFVRALCELVGLGTDNDWYALDDGSAVLSAARVFDVSENVLQSMAEVSFDHGLELLDDGYGRVVLRPVPDPSAQAVAWDFPFAAGTRLLRHQRTLRRKGTAYNRTRVIGIAPDHYPIVAEARDLNPASPTYNPTDGSGPLGDRPAPPYVSTDIHQQDQANAVAARLLREYALTETIATSDSMPLPGLEDRAVVTFGGLRYLLDRVSMPLGPGRMTMTSRRVYSMDAG